MLTHLLFMRHAKPSWGDESLSDHERPLNELGRREADIIANTLTARGLAPDTIWASDAVRTQETATRLIRIIPGPQTIIKVPGFYHASAGHVLEQCAKAEPPSGNLMLLGHNPGWSELAQIFTNNRIDMPTACCLVFARTNTTQQPWITPENWRLIDSFYAAELLADSTYEIDDE